MWRVGLGWRRWRLASAGTRLSREIKPMVVKNFMRKLVTTKKSILPIDSIKSSYHQRLTQCDYPTPLATAVGSRIAADGGHLLFVVFSQHTVYKVGSG